MLKFSGIIMALLALATISILFNKFGSPRRSRISNEPNTQGKASDIVPETIVENNILPLEKAAENAPAVSDKPIEKESTPPEKIETDGSTPPEKTAENEPAPPETIETNGTTPPENTAENAPAVSDKPVEKESTQPEKIETDGNTPPEKTAENEPALPETIETNGTTPPENTAENAPAVSDKPVEKESTPPEKIETDGNTPPEKTAENEPAPPEKIETNGSTPPEKTAENEPAPPETIETNGTTPPENTAENGPAVSDKPVETESAPPEKIAENEPAPPSEKIETNGTTPPENIAENAPAVSDKPVEIGSAPPEKTAESEPAPPETIETNGSTPPEKTAENEPAPPEKIETNGTSPPENTAGNATAIPDKPVENESVTPEKIVTNGTTPPENTAGNATAIPDKPVENESSPPVKIETNAITPPENTAENAPAVSDKPVEIEAAPPEKTAESEPAPPEKIETNGSTPPENTAENAPAVSDKPVEIGSAPPEKTAESEPAPPEKIETNGSTPPEKTAENEPAPPEKIETNGTSPPENTAGNATAIPDKPVENESVTPEKIVTNGTTPPENTAGNATAIPDKPVENESAPPVKIETNGTTPPEETAGNATAIPDKPVENQSASPEKIETKGTTPPEKTAENASAVSNKTVPLENANLTEKTVKDTQSVVDPSSHSRPKREVIENIDFNWNVDFERQIVNGIATYTIKILADNTKEIFLDVNDIDIKKITVKIAGTEIPVEYSISDDVKNIGSKLTIKLPKETSGSLILLIEYETSSHANALKWLTPMQTLGKKQPYLYSQSQPIAARSLFPCQDTPAVKFTYTATVTHPKDLTALLSGIRLNSTAGLTKYEQTIPVPSYLVAIVVGDVVSRKISGNILVWAEKEIVDEAAAEFSETENMLQKAIEICGPYVWKRYDLLVMPPSFPFGGMENPCLTFVTPTLLAGDKSLTSIIAHEIAHSWTGNMVTNVNYEHFWLNEGFTTFVEGKIIGRLQGPLERDFFSIKKVQGLKEVITGQFGKRPELTKLVLNLTGVSPDESFSSVPYAKGATFLCYLEDLLGGPQSFEPFLRFYLDKYKFQSITTEDFRVTLNDYFKKNYEKELAQIDWKTWLYGEGMPPVIPKFNTTLVDVAYRHANIWITRKVDNIKPAIPSVSLSPQQTIEFLRKLNDAKKIVDLSTKWISLLESTYGLNKTKNSEIRFQFLRLCIKARQFNRLDEIIAFANSNFRVKFVRPIYRDLSKWPEAKDIAIANYKKVKPEMMAVTQFQVGVDLGPGLVLD